MSGKPVHPGATDLGQYDAVLLDLDGTVYHEEHALPGAVNLVRRLQRQGKPYACLTNSTSSPERIVARLGRMGVEVDPAHVYTAARAAADYVLERFAGQSPAPGSGTSADAIFAPAAPPPDHAPRVFNLSTEGILEMLEGKVQWVETSDAPCDAVICGVPLNPFATPERQRNAMLLLRSGAALVAICADRIYPSPRGLEFGVGSMAAMLAYAAAVQPVYTGKPEKFFFVELCRRLGVDPARCVLVGDNLESDIAGAKGVGMRTILTLSGITRREDLSALSPERSPDAVIRDLSDL